MISKRPGGITVTAAVFFFLFPVTCSIVRRVPPRGSQGPTAAAAAV